MTITDTQEGSGEEGRGGGCAIVQFCDYLQISIRVLLYRDEPVSV